MLASFARQADDSPRLKGTGKRQLSDDDEPINSLSSKRGKTAAAEDSPASRTGSASRGGRKGRRAGTPLLINDDDYNPKRRSKAKPRASAASQAEASSNKVQVETVEPVHLDDLPQVTPAEPSAGSTVGSSSFYSSKSSGHGPLSALMRVLNPRGKSMASKSQKERPAEPTVDRLTDSDVEASDMLVSAGDVADKADEGIGADEDDSRESSLPATSRPASVTRNGKAITGPGASATTKDTPVSQKRKGRPPKKGAAGAQGASNKDATGTSAGSGKDDDPSLALPTFQRLRKSSRASRNIRKMRKFEEEGVRRIRSNRDALRSALGEPQDFYDVDVEIRVHDDPHVVLKVWHLDTVNKHTELQPHTIVHHSSLAGRTVSSFRYASDTRGVIAVEMQSVLRQARSRHAFRSHGDRVLLELKSMKGEWTILE